MKQSKLEGYGTYIKWQNDISTNLKWSDVVAHE